MPALLDQLPPYVLLVHLPVNPAWTERRCYYLKDALTLTLSTGRSITIPAGFCTDGASVPQALQSFFPAYGDHFLADLIHDYLYARQPCTKAEADREFLIWMRLLRPARQSQVDNLLRYWAVRLGGGRAWDRH